MEPSHRAAPLWTKNFVSIWLANFFLFISMHMLIPTFPVYIARMGADKFTIGIAFAIFTIASLFVRPYAGKSLDAFGRRQIVIIGLSIFILSTAGYIWLAAFTFIYIVRLVHGIGWGIVTTSFGTIVSEIIPPERRGEGFGYYGLSNNLSMALGPFFGVWLMDNFGFDLLFMTSVLLSFIALLLSQMLRLRISTMPKTLKFFDLNFFTKGLVEKSALLPSVLMTCISFSYGGVITFIILFGDEAGIEHVGLFFVMNAIMMMILRSISGRIFDRKGHPWVLIPGAVLVGIGILILSYSNSLFTILLSAAIYGAGYGMMTPALQAWIINIIPPERRGAASGTFYSAIDLGIASGSIILGAVATITGYALMYRLSVGLVIIFLAIYFIQLWKAKKHVQHTLPGG